MTFTVVNMMSEEEIIGQSVFEFAIEISKEVGSLAQTHEKYNKLTTNPTL